MAQYEKIRCRDIRFTGVVYLRVLYLAEVITHSTEHSILAITANRAKLETLAKVKLHI